MMAPTLSTLLLAMLIDRIVGDPPWLWKHLPHPVVLFGNAIAFAERHLNKPHWAPAVRRSNGVVVIAVLLCLSAFVGLLVHGILVAMGPLGWLIEAVVIAILLAQKSLSDHVGAVARALRREGIEGGRRAVSMIVGRDPDPLDESGVSRAAIESLAENFSDGVIAPAFWYVVLGLPGLFAYKMLNTADSMIGHKSERYRDFGWASARLDDLANLAAARLSMLLVAAGALMTRGVQAGRAALRVGLRDSRLHRSPNAGWPESAMAGALGIGLAGPRVYGGVAVEEPMINASGRTVIGASEIEAAVIVYHASCTAGAALVFVLLLGFL